MFLLRAPGQRQVDAFLAGQATAPFSYPEVGATQGLSLPRGYRHIRASAELGEAEHFDHACRLLRSWCLFKGPIVTLRNPQAAFAPGSTLALHVRHYGFHSLIANRVVYAIDEPDRFGFAYGTLTGHPEQGEECFLLERHNGRLVFRIRGFSTACHPLAILGRPLGLALQRAAIRGYLRSMQRQRSS